MINLNMQSIIIVSIGVIYPILAQISYSDLDDTLRNELEAAFDQSRNRALLASTVRLIFHDCAGQQEGNFNGFGGSICDGCIDFDNDKNAGLQSLAVEPLDDIYISSPNNWRQRGLTRSDFWAAAATIAVQYAHDLDNNNDILPDIPFYIGRTDCSGSPDADVTATNYLLPYKQFPNEKGGWDENLRWFQTNFGFDVTKTIAIIGAHTLGRLHSQFSGYGTTRGAAWVGQDDQLNHDFYKDLLRRNWIQRLNDQGLQEWNQAGNTNRVFLNSDIALVRYIDDDIIDTNTGELSCTFQSCPTNVEAASLAQLYSNNNQEWLNDFADAFHEMIQMGYNNNNNLQILTENNGVSTNVNPINPSPSSPPTTPSPPPIFVPRPSTSSTSTTSSTSNQFIPSQPTRRPRGRGRGNDP